MYTSENLILEGKETYTLEFHSKNIYNIKSKTNVY